ncbi:hypothetical protein HDV04_000785 [Boothiomyces sp. JEL0838]|nr:hypothetical protein HDV04_000785 [Boothiomyces sp. JEL0838]
MLCECGTTNVEGAKFCARCGSKLKPIPITNTCDNCGTPLGDAKFCSGCGTRSSVGDGSDNVTGQKGVGGQDSMHFQQSPIVGQNVPLNARALNQPQAGSLPNGQYNLPNLMPQPNASNQGYYQAQSRQNQPFGTAILPNQILNQISSTANQVVGSPKTLISRLMGREVDGPYKQSPQYSPVVNPNQPAGFVQPQSYPATVSNNMNAQNYGQYQGNESSNLDVSNSPSQSQNYPRNNQQQRVGTPDMTLTSNQRGQHIQQVQNEQFVQYAPRLQPQPVPQGPYLGLSDTVQMDNNVVNYQQPYAGDGNPLYNMQTGNQPARIGTPDPSARQSHFSQFNNQGNYVGNPQMDNQVFQANAKSSSQSNVLQNASGSRMANSSSHGNLVSQGNPGNQSAMEMQSQVQANAYQNQPYGNLSKTHSNSQQMLNQSIATGNQGVSIDAVPSVTSNAQPNPIIYGPNVTPNMVKAAPVTDGYSVSTDKVEYFVPGENNFENLATSRAPSSLPGANFVVVQSDMAIQNVNNGEYLIDPNTGRRVEKPKVGAGSISQGENNTEYLGSPPQTAQAVDRNIPNSQATNVLAPQPTNQVSQLLAYNTTLNESNMNHIMQQGQLAGSNQEAPQSTNYNPDIPANYIAKTPPVNNSSNLENVSSARPVVQTDTTGLNYLIKGDSKLGYVDPSLQMYAQPVQNELQQNQQYYERQQVKQMLSNGTYTPTIQHSQSPNVPPNPMQSQTAGVQPQYAKDYNSKPQANTQNMMNQGPKQDISKPVQQPLPNEVYDDLEPGKKFMVNVNPNDPKAKDYEISQIVQNGNNIEVKLKKAKKTGPSEGGNQSSQPLMEPVYQPPMKPAYQPPPLQQSKDRKFHFWIGVLATVFFPIVSTIVISCIKTKSPYARADKMLGAAVVYLIEAAAAFIICFLILSCSMPNRTNYVFGYNNPLYTNAMTAYTNCNFGYYLSMSLGIFAGLVTLLTLISSLNFALKAKKSLATVKSVE